MYSQEKSKSSYYFNKTDNWYAFSIDSPEDQDDFRNLFTPDWALPFFEAISFFNENPNK